MHHPECTRIQTHVNVGQLALIPRSPAPSEVSTTHINNNAAIKRAQLGLHAQISETPASFSTQGNKQTGKGRASPSSRKPIIMSSQDHIAMATVPFLFAENSTFHCAL